MKTVLITGAGGFIAKAVAAELKARHVRVIGTSRNSFKNENFDEIYRARLGESLEEVFKKENQVDAVIHAANEMSPAASELNTSGTVKWAEEAFKNGAETQIFLSSLSAKKDSPNNYGRAKAHTEDWFLKNNGIVLRLGLVVGNGGLFGRIITIAKTLPIVPLLSGGTSLIYYQGIEQTAKIISDVALGEAKIPLNELRGKVWMLQQENPVTLRNAIEQICTASGRKFRIISFPAGLALQAVLFFEKLKIPLPVTSDNIKGLFLNSQRQVHSDYSKFGYPNETIESLTRKLS
jgi:nucleoside-diphosphate-sugar epimerase